MKIEPHMDSLCRRACLEYQRQMIPCNFNMQMSDCQSPVIGIPTNYLLLDKEYFCKGANIVAITKSNVEFFGALYFLFPWLLVKVCWGFHLKTSFSCLRFGYQDYTSLPLYFVLYGW